MIINSVFNDQSVVRIKKVQVLCKKLTPIAKPNNPKHTLTHTAYSTYFSFKSCQIGVRWLALAALFQVMIQEFEFFPLYGSQHLPTEFSLGGWAKNGVTLRVRAGNHILLSPSHCLKIVSYGQPNCKGVWRVRFSCAWEEDKDYMGSRVAKRMKNEFHPILQLKRSISFDYKCGCSRCLWCPKSHTTSQSSPLVNDCQCLFPNMTSLCFSASGFFLKSWCHHHN